MFKKGQSVKFTNKGLGHVNRPATVVNHDKAAGMVKVEMHHSNGVKSTTYAKVKDVTSDKPIGHSVHPTGKPGEYQINYHHTTTGLDKAAKSGANTYRYEGNGRVADHKVSQEGSKPSVHGSGKNPGTNGDFESKHPRDDHGKFD